MSLPEPPVSPAITSEPSSPSDMLKVVSVLQLLLLIGTGVLIVATYNSIRAGILKLETAVRIQRHALSERPMPLAEDGTSASGPPITPEPTGATSDYKPKTSDAVLRVRRDGTPYTEFFDLG